MNIDVRGSTDMSGNQVCGPMADKRNMSCITIFGNKSTSIYIVVHQLLSYKRT